MFIRRLLLVVLVVSSLSFSFQPRTQAKARYNNLLVALHQTTSANNNANTTTMAKSVAALRDELSKSELQKIKSTGCLDIERKVKITGEPHEKKDQMNGGSDNEMLRDTKIIHFQRHGEGTHNVLYTTWTQAGNTIDWDSKDPKCNPLLTKTIIDAPLTELGIQQCTDKKFEASLVNPELIIVSPLQRAIQSAELTWGNKSDVPWIAHEACREEFGLLQCNKRRPKSVIQNEYPNIDLSLMVSDHDSLFLEDRRETNVEKADRIYEFLTQYVRNLPQSEIAIIGHSAWLFHMCNAVMDIPDKDLTTWFGTSEIRSMKVTFTDIE